MMSTWITNGEYETSVDYSFMEFSTSTRPSFTITPPSSSSVFHEKNFLRFLSLIASFCVLLISSSFIYGFWSIRKHSYLLWPAALDSQIHFLFRRSLRSSDRSNPKIATIAQILDELDQIDQQQPQPEPSIDSFTPSSEQSSSNISYYTYL